MEDEVIIDKNSLDYQYGYRSGYKAGHAKGRYSNPSNPNRKKRMGRTYISRNENYAYWVMKRDGECYCSNCGTKNRQAYDCYCCKCGFKMSEEALYENN